MAKANKPTVKIGLHDVQETLGGIRINSTELVNALISHQTETLSFLTAQIGSIDISKIVVDNHGRILIKDPTLATSIKTKLTGGAGKKSVVDNGICGIKC